VQPEIRYAQSSGAAIAYQVVGEGETDLVFVPDFGSNLVYAWESPYWPDFYEDLARRFRLILPAFHRHRRLDRARRRGRRPLVARAARSASRPDSARAGPVPGRGEGHGRRRLLRDLRRTGASDSLRAGGPRKRGRDRGNLERVCGAL